jgi:hypothetical protein
MKNHLVSRTVVALILAAAIAAAAAGYLDTAARWAGLGYLESANEHYLKTSFDDAIRGFLVLSGVKSGLAVIEGSEVGIGFNLELGDIVQSVYDYVDVAWRTVLAGGTVLLLTRMVLEGVSLVDHWCLALTLTVLLLTWMADWMMPTRQRLQHGLREVALFVSVWTISLYIAVPMAIAGASYLSGKISRPLIEETQAEFAGVQDLFSAEQLKDRFFPSDTGGEEGWTSRLARATDLEAVQDRLQETAVFMKERTREMAVWTIKLIAGYLFDCIVFPVALFLLLYLFVRGVLRYLLRGRRNRRFKDELETMLTARTGQLA